MLIRKSYGASGAGKGGGLIEVSGVRFQCKAETVGIAVVNRFLISDVGSRFSTRTLILDT